MMNQDKSVDKNSYIIDVNSLVLPTVIATDEAVLQLKLIMENDFTLLGKWPRIVISGKGCDGFNYSLGFTDLDEQDLRIPLVGQSGTPLDFEIIMDSFTAFYMQETLIEYAINPQTNQDGFVITNKRQKEFHGKFWREDKSKIPPQK